MKLTKTRTANAHCTRLAPQVTVDAQAYTSLPVHEQTRLRCLAATLSAHRAVLAACSAARVHRLWVLSARGEEDIELALAGTVPPIAQVPPGWRYRKMKLPPALRAISQFISAVRRLPTWMCPVGDGAKRVVVVILSSEARAAASAPGSALASTAQASRASDGAASGVIRAGI